MTVQLTTKLKLFIERMTRSEEQAQWGYELLLKRPDCDEFFDHLKSAGLFGAEHNRGPVPADQPGYVSIPYWHALDYLEAVAKRAGETNNLQLAEKVMSVVRDVSEAREPDGSIRDNYHTYHKFAEIVGMVPTAAVTPDRSRRLPTCAITDDKRTSLIGACANRDAICATRTSRSASRSHHSGGRSVARGDRSLFCADQQEFCTC